MEVPEVLATEILNKVVIDCMQRYQKKLNVGIQDSVADLLTDFKQKMITAIFEVAQTWTLSTKREKTLFPRDCRFLYTIGRSTIVVIEQMPGLRTLAMAEDILGTTRSVRDTIKRVGLSLPYSVFVLHFLNANENGSGTERFVDMFYAWRTTSLEQFSDRLCIPLLPNIHQTLCVCRGSDAPALTGNIVEQSRQIIDNFWNSSFNNDLSEFWWAKSEVDTRLKSGNLWAQCSANNPLFILDVQLQPAQTLEELFTFIINAHEQTVDFGEADRLKQSLRASVENCAQRLFEKINRYTKEKNFEPFYPTAITAELEKSIASISEQVTSIVFSLQIELNKAVEHNHGIQKNVSHFGWKPCGKYWG